MLLHQVGHCSESGVEIKRGFWWFVSDLEGDLDANERVEMGNTCLGGEWRVAEGGFEGVMAKPEKRVTDWGR